MFRKAASLLCVSVFLCLAAMASHASRVYITGAFLPQADSALSPAGQYAQVYVNASIDPQGVVTGQTSVAGVSAHVWGSAIHASVGDGTISVVTACTWQGQPALSTIMFTRRADNKTWDVVIVVEQSDALGLVSVVARSVGAFNKGTWIAKK